MREEEDDVQGSMAREEEAFAWVVRLSSDQRTRQDEAQFSDWLAADEQNGLLYAEGLELWDAMGALRSNPHAHAELGHLLPKAFEQDNAPEPKGLSRRAALGSGLGLLAATLTGILVLPKVLTESSVVYETAKGEQRRFVLDDGSTVTLDTATRLQVAFQDDQRLLTLERGQAFFDVAHDPGRPFRVFAGKDEIRALGTAFEVRFENGQARVILEEGRVAVFRHASAKTAATQPQKQAARPALILEPGQEMKLAEAKAVQAEPVDLSKTNAWRDGQMVFDDVSLADAVAEVNRYGGREVVLADPQLKGLRVSGTFHTNRPEAFVEGVTAALPVRLRQSDANRLVLTQI